MKFSDEQQKIIDHKDGNLLVSAAAGSGKTTVMVEHVISRITAKENPTDIDRMLIVTFARAAAASMRDKITKALNKTASERPEDARIRRQLTLVHNASICTIDSFCAQVVNNHFSEIGLDPDCRMAAEDEMAELAKLVMEELFEELYEARDESFLALVEMYSKRHDDKGLREIVSQLSKAANASPWPVEWLEKCKEDYNVGSLEEMLKSDWFISYFHMIRRKFEYMVRVSSEGFALVSSNSEYAKYLPAFTAESESFRNLYAEEDPQRFFANAQVVFDRMPGIKSTSVSDPEELDYIKALRAAYKKVYGNVQKKFLTSTPEIIFGEMQEMRGPVNALVDLTITFYNRFMERKREEKVRDFSDTAHYALDILLHKEKGCEPVPTEVARMYQAHFDEIITDEYQDSNYIQEYLLWAISGDASDKNIHNRFMVGDVKQSIYSFRMAQPEIFMGKYHDYFLCEAGEHTEGRKILLSQNFRSRSEVLDSTNDVFVNIMRAEVGDVEYDEGHMLHTGNKDYPVSADDTFKTELIILGKSQEELDAQLAEAGKDAENTGDEGATGAENVNASVSKEEATLAGDEQDISEGLEGLGEGEGGMNEAAEEEPLEDLLAQATIIARKISEMVRNGYPVFDGKTKTTRPARYSDFCILSRSVSSWGDLLDKALAEQQIASVNSDNKGYYNTMEIRTILNYLRVLDNPLHDIPLFGLLTSIFFGFTNKEIAIIRAKGRTVGETHKKKVPLYTCLTEFEGDVAIREKIDKFLETIARYRKCIPYTTVGELISMITEESGYISAMYALPGGRQRRANLELLFAKAESFEVGGKRGLSHFVKYISDLKSHDIDVQTARVDDEEADAVRIMTIHKSKGLEFPICFLAGVGKQYKGVSKTNHVAIDNRLGFGTDFIDLKKRMCASSVYADYLNFRRAADARGEELRVLYVAMTRAMEKLIIVGSIGKLTREKFESKVMADMRFDASGRLTEESLLEAKISALHFLYPIAVTHPEHFDVHFESMVFAGASEIATRDFLPYRAGEGEVTEKLSKMVDRLHYEYPHAGAKELCTKVTVSRLKIAAMEESEIAGETAQKFEASEKAKYIPAFARKAEEPSGAARGDAYHHICELMDFGGLKDSCILDTSTMSHYVCDKKEAARLMQAILQRGRITQEEYDLVSPYKMADFLSSNAAYRMSLAAERGKLRKEQPFVIGIAANRVEEEYPSDEKILMQGIVDVFWEETDGLVVLDYKTDAVDSEEELKERYRKQLYLYAEALTLLTKKPVKEMILYSFSLGREMKL